MRRTRPESVSPARGRGVSKLVAVSLMPSLLLACFLQLAASSSAPGSPSEGLRTTLARESPGVSAANTLPKREGPQHSEPMPGAGEAATAKLSFVLGRADSIAKLEALSLTAQREGDIWLASRLLLEQELEVARLNSALTSVLRSFDIGLAQHAEELLPFLLASSDLEAALDALLPYVESMQEEGPGTGMAMMVAGLLLSKQGNHGLASRYFERASSERFRLGLHASYLAIECSGRSGEFGRMVELEGRLQERLEKLGETATAEEAPIEGVSESKAASAAAGVRAQSRLNTREEADYIHKKARIATGIALLGSSRAEEGRSMLEALSALRLSSGEASEVGLALGNYHASLGQSRRAADYYYDAFAGRTRNPASLEACRQYLSLVRRGAASPPRDKLMALASCLARADMQADAASILEALRKKYPRSREVAWELARLYYRTKERAKAAPIFRALQDLERDPAESERALLWYARCEREQGKRDSAMKLLRDIERRRRGAASLEAGWERGVELESAGKLEEAAEAYASLARTFPKTRIGQEALWRNGFCQYKLGKLAEARDKFSSLANNTDLDELRDAAVFWMLKCDVDAGKSVSTEGLAGYSSYGRPASGKSLYGMLLKKLANSWSPDTSALRTPLWMGLGGAAPEAHGQAGQGAAIDAPQAGDAIDWLRPELENGATLFRLGLDELAVQELLICERNSRDDPDELGLVAQVYWRNGLYRKGILVADRVLSQLERDSRARAKGGRTASTGQSGDSPLELLMRRLAHPVCFTRPLAEESRSQGIDPFLVLAVMKKESAFDETAVSGAGAVGLMQLMPATARSVASYLGDNPIGLDLTDPALNMRYGIWHLGRLVGRYSGSVVDALAAYNAGEDNAERWRRLVGQADAFVYMESITYRETRDYVRNVLADFHTYTEIYSRR